MTCANSIRGPLGVLVCWYAPVSLGEVMRRREFIGLLGGAAASWPLAVCAQQGEPMRRVGVLMPYAEGDPEGQASVAALQRALQDLGWTEGRNIRFDIRWAGGNPDKARTFAKELIGMTPDVIVPSSNQVTSILQQETRTIPIVFVLVGDPVGSGYVANMAQPGGNLTGFAVLENAIAGKRLDALNVAARGRSRRDDRGQRVSARRARRRRDRAHCYRVCGGDEWWFDRRATCYYFCKSRPHHRISDTLSASRSLWVS